MVQWWHCTAPNLCYHRPHCFPFLPLPLTLTDSQVLGSGRAADRGRRRGSGCRGAGGPAGCLCRCAQHHAAGKHEPCLLQQVQCFLSSPAICARIAVCSGQHGSRRTSIGRLSHLQICVAADEDSVPKPSSAQQRFVTALQVRVHACICCVSAGADFQDVAGILA